MSCDLCDAMSVTTSVSDDRCPYCGAEFAPADEPASIEFCPKRNDATHCYHWWDDDGPCCACGSDAGSKPRKSNPSKPVTGR